MNTMRYQENSKKNVLFIFFIFFALNCARQGTSGLICVFFSGRLHCISPRPSSCFSRAALAIVVFCSSIIQLLDEGYLDNAGNGGGRNKLMCGWMVKDRSIICLFDNCMMKYLLYIFPRFFFICCSRKEYMAILEKLGKEVANFFFYLFLFFFFLNFQTRGHGMRK